MGRFSLRARREALARRVVSKTVTATTRQNSGLRRARVLALLALAAFALVGCGGDTPKTSPSPSPESPATGPLARWRRATESAAPGRPVVIEALRDCRVRTAFRVRDQGVPDRVESRRDLPLRAGDSVRISWSIEKGPPAGPAVPPEVDRAAGRRHLVTHLFRTGIDEEATALRSDPVWTQDDDPWVRIERTEGPPVALDFPDGEVALGAVGVADGVGPAAPAGSAPRLELSASPPRLVGAPPPTPGAARYVSAFVVSVLPAGAPGD